MNLQTAIAATQQPDWLNPLFATLYARSKETPAKTWWHAEAMHPAIFRALKMDRAEYGAVFAAAPFRLYRGPDGARILAALPTPRILAPHDDDDWLGIETVLAWDPRSDAAEVMDDPGPAIVDMPDHAEALDLHTSPFEYFRAIAEARAQWFTAWNQIERDWRQRPAEPRHFVDVALLIGAPDKVRWPIHSMPENIACHGIDPKALNRALLRQAGIPRAVAALSPIRKAAA